MPEHRPEISVSIVSYNTRHALRSCLRNLQARAREEELSLEVIVADNDSRDGSAAMVESEFPDVRLLRTGGNLGYGRANNLALREARGNYFLVLNSDAELGAGALSAMQKYLRQNPGLAACGAQLQGSDGALQPSCGGAPNFWSLVLEQSLLDQAIPSLRRFNFHHAYARQTYARQSQPCAVEWLCGACFLARRQAWEQARGFDERYWMYMEDVDLCARWRRLGWSVALLPQARALHQPGGSSTSREARARMIASLAHGRLLFWAEHGLWPSPRVLRALFLGGALLRALGWSLLALARPRLRARARLFRDVYRQIKAIGDAALQSSFPT